ncbi:hypothetical protein [Ktedonobacter racemifer]|uniref:Uncharacterized protein n=1 Tax=Ktedonobacter racemifer DSM 44963 TaxID=485913 RepID=D6U039_KTERA|nr:hypothetical protein [Ktedonobacter racemifer]EFH82179.1 hypothetical protein Krac_2966 [Ktedonobacter racemifer DSM 44963]
MSVITTPERSVKKWRVMVFAVVAALFALLCLIGFFGAAGLLVPWIPGIIPLIQESVGPLLPGEHWHIGVTGVLLSFPLYRTRALDIFFVVFPAK